MVFLMGDSGHWVGYAIMGQRAGLSVTAIKAAKGRDKPYKLTDGDGLFLLVTPSGGRYWRMNHRYLSKQKTLAFGVWPETGLADAREKRDAARKLLARGDDPAEVIRLEKLSASIAAANSFKAVADEWLVTHAASTLAQINTKDHYRYRSAPFPSQGQTPFPMLRKRAGHPIMC